MADKALSTEYSAPHEDQIVRNNSGEGPWLMYDTHDSAVNLHLNDSLLQKQQQQHQPQRQQQQQQQQQQHDAAVAAPVGAFADTGDAGDAIGNRDVFQMFHTAPAAAAAAEGGGGVATEATGGASAYEYSNNRSGTASHVSTRVSAVPSLPLFSSIVQPILNTTGAWTEGQMGQSIDMRSIPSNEGSTLQCSVGPTTSVPSAPPEGFITSTFYADPAAGTGNAGAHMVAGVPLSVPVLGSPPLQSVNGSGLPMMYSFDPATATHRVLTSTPPAPPVMYYAVNSLTGQPVSVLSSQQQQHGTADSVVLSPQPFIASATRLDALHSPPHYAAASAAASLDTSANPQMLAAAMNQQQQQSHSQQAFQYVPQLPNATSVMMLPGSLDRLGSRDVLSSSQGSEMQGGGGYSSMHNSFSSGGAAGGGGTGAVTGSKARRNVYVTNLPLSWNTSKLREVCGAYGTIISAKVMHHERSNTSLGYGFVLFQHEAHAAMCIEQLNERVVEDPTAVAGEVGSSFGIPGMPVPDGIATAAIENAAPGTRVLLCRYAHERAAPSFESIASATMEVTAAAAAAAARYPQVPAPSLVQPKQSQRDAFLMSLSNGEVVLLNNATSAPSSGGPVSAVEDSGMSNGNSVRALSSFAFSTSAGGNLAGLTSDHPLNTPAHVPRRSSEMGSGRLANSGREATACSNSSGAESLSGSLHKQSHLNQQQQHHHQQQQYLTPVSTVNQVAEGASSMENGNSHPQSTGRQSAAPSGSGSGSSCNVYVTNIPLTWNTTKLTELCSRYGTIVSAKVAHHPTTNDSLGYGFVLYDNHESAAACVEQLNTLWVPGALHGGALQCRFAKDKATPSIARNLASSTSATSLSMSGSDEHAYNGGGDQVNSTGLISKMMEGRVMLPGSVFAALREVARHVCRCIVSSQADKKATSFTGVESSDKDKAAVGGTTMMDEDEVCTTPATAMEMDQQTGTSDYPELSGATGDAITKNTNAAAAATAVASSNATEVHHTDEEAVIKMMGSAVVYASRLPGDFHIKNSVSLDVSLPTKDAESVARLLTSGTPSGDDNGLTMETDSGVVRGAEGLATEVEVIEKPENRGSESEVREEDATVVCHEEDSHEKKKKRPAANAGTTSVYVLRIRESADKDSYHACFTFASEADAKALVDGRLMSGASAPSQLTAIDGEVTEGTSTGPKSDEAAKLSAAAATMDAPRKGLYCFEKDVLSVTAPMTLNRSLLQTHRQATISSVTSPCVSPASQLPSQPVGVPMYQCGVMTPPPYSGPGVSGVAPGSYHAQMSQLQLQQQQQPPQYIHHAHQPPPQPMMAPMMVIQSSGSFSHLAAHPGGAASGHIVGLNPQLMNTAAMLSPTHSSTGVGSPLSMTAEGTLASAMISPLVSPRMEFQNQQQQHLQHSQSNYVLPAFVSPAPQGGAFMAATGLGMGITSSHTNTFPVQQQQQQVPVRLQDGTTAYVIANSSGYCLPASMGV